MLAMAAAPSSQGADTSARGPANDAPSTASAGTGAVAARNTATPRRICRMLWKSIGPPWTQAWRILPLTSPPRRELRLKNPRYAARPSAASGVAQLAGSRRIRRRSLSSDPTMQRLALVLLLLLLGACTPLVTQQAGQPPLGFQGPRL